LCAVAVGALDAVAEAVVFGVFVGGGSANRRIDGGGFAVEAVVDEVGLIAFSVDESGLVSVFVVLFLSHRQRNLNFWLRGTGRGDLQMRSRFQTGQNNR